MQNLVLGELAPWKRQRRSADLKIDEFLVAKSDKAFWRIYDERCRTAVVLGDKTPRGNMSSRISTVARTFRQKDVFVDQEIEDGEENSSLTLKEAALLREKD